MLYEVITVMGQINSTYGNFRPGFEMVCNAQKMVAVEDPFTETILTDTNEKWLDFPKHADHVHYNTEGQKRLGTAMAVCLIDLQRKPIVQPSTYIDMSGIIRRTTSNKGQALKEVLKA